MDNLYEKGELVYICGLTGSGKTTLLKNIKSKLQEKAGYVMQNPNNQIITKKVYSELAFSLLEAADERVAEIASYFGITKWMDRNTDTLSGGEKQILCIASVVSLMPEVLLLDEPTSMLDPVAAERVNSIIKRLNRELGMTILVAGHKSDDIFSSADRILVVDNSMVTFSGTPSEAAEYLKNNNMKKLLPTVTQIFCEQDYLPLSIKQGNALLKKVKLKKAQYRSYDEGIEPVISVKDVFYSYEKKGKAILNGIDLTIMKGETLAILGENGSGKTTLSYLIAGIRKPYSGTIKIHGSVAYLCQDITNHFIEDEYNGINPYELSGGEQQKLALDIILQNKCDILILDEPTKGLDEIEKERLKERIRLLKADKMTIVIFTHDIEFTAEISDRTGLMFAGTLKSCDRTDRFFSDNILYTTTAGRLWRNIDRKVLTIDEARSCL